MDEATRAFIYEAVEWDDPLAGADASKRPPKAVVEEAQRSGARRKKVVRGEEGFYMNRSQMPASFEVPVHQHSHSELLVVLAGGCRFDDGETQVDLGPDDSIVIRAHTRYGFVCGPDGMDFLTIRTGEASVEMGG